MPVGSLNNPPPRNSRRTHATATARSAVNAGAKAATGSGAKSGAAETSHAVQGELNTSALEELLGYNARRAALSVIEAFLPAMQPFGVRPVEFSILVLIMHNPGVTARQLCTALGLQPPNLVAPLADFESRGLIERRPHPQDGRAWGLHGTSQGQTLVRQAHAQALSLEQHVVRQLSTAEQATLKRLLQKVYKKPVPLQN